MNLTLASTDNPATKWWFLAVASLGLFSNYYVYDAVGPLVDVLNRQLGFSDMQVGTLNDMICLLPAQRIHWAIRRC